MVDTQVTITDAVAAIEAVSGLNAQLAAGTLTLGGVSVLSVSAAVSLVSTGPSVASISPNIASAAENTVTTITVTGSSGSAFDDATRMSIDGAEYVPTILSTTTLKLEVPSNPQATAISVMIVGGSNSATLFQYNASVVRMNDCLPQSGKQVGGTAGGGVVILSAVKLQDIMTIPDLDKSTFKCRFGPSLVVDADELSLAESGTIKCLPPTSISAGPVEVSVTFNNGNQWLSSETVYTYTCDDHDNYFDPEATGECLECPKGGACNGGAAFSPKQDFWRHEGQALNSTVYECPFKDGPCPGGYNSSCGSGYSGILCAVCDHEHYLAPNGCLACSGISIVTLAAIIIVGFTVLAALLTWLVATCDSRVEGEESDESLFSIELDISSDDNNGSATEDELLLNHQANSGDVGVPSMQMLTPVELKLEPGIFVNNLPGVKSEESVKPLTKCRVLLNLLKDRISGSMGHFKIMFGVLQIVSTFISNFDVPWPNVFISWCEFAQVTNVEVYDVANLQCSFPKSDFYNKLVIQIITPVVLVLCLFAAARIRIWRKASRGTSTPLKTKTKIENQHMFAFLFLLFVIYPGVSSTIAKFFKCTQIDGIWMLDADLRLECYSSEWLFYIPIALVGILMYPIGIPACVGLLLHQNEAYLHHDVASIETQLNSAHSEEDLLRKLIDQVDGTLDNAVVSASLKAYACVQALTVELEQVRSRLFRHEIVRFRYGMMYMQYSTHASYWELVLFLHKLLLTSVIIFIQSGTTAQIAAAFIINLGFVCAHVQTNAFKTTSENAAQFVALISILLVLFSGVVLRWNKLDNTDNGDKDYNSITIICVLMTSQGVVVSLFARNLFHQVDMKECKIKSML